MSAPIAVLLDSTRIRAFVQDANGPTLEIPWDPALPEAAVAKLRDTFGTSSSSVLVVGLGFLEIARPELPPLASKARRDVLMRDADRYFPIDGDIAVAWTNGVAFAMASETLDALVRAFDVLAPVRAVTTIAHACLMAGCEGSVVVDAGQHEHGQLTIAGNLLLEARRVPGSVQTTQAARATDTPNVVRASLALIHVPGDQLLLDVHLSDRFAALRHKRWLRSGAVLVASFVLFAWSADNWRERELATLQQRIAILRVSAAPALIAQQRLWRAATERGMLGAADSVTRVGAGPAIVLAQLSAVLPMDAFIQRLEWDGIVWRIDGSANDAARIVPLLDADLHFQDVRFVAASTRFVDGSRQRESFSIAFRTRSPTGTSSSEGVHGAP